MATGGTDAAGCTNASNPCLTVGYAVTQSSTSGDTIHIGPGTFAQAINTPKDISFVGAGSGTAFDASGATVIDGRPNPAFTLTGGGALSDLRALGGQSSAPAAVELDGPSSAPGVSYALAGVTAVRNDCFGCRALDVRGGNFTDPSLLSLNVADSSFVSTDPDGTTSFVNEANANFVRSAFTGQGSDVGGLLMEAGTLTFTDGTIGIAGSGGGDAEVGVGAHATFTRTRIMGFGMRLDGSMLPVDASVNDSLVTGIDNGVSVLFGATLSARNSTFIAEGSTAQSGADLEAGIGGDAVVNSTGSIFRANGNPGALDVKLSSASGHTSTFTADHSSYTSLLTGGASATPAGSGSNIAGDPGFVNEAGGDFHLASGSPLIDRGAAALPGELDLDGSPRALTPGCGTPASDIGAFEFVPRFVPPCVAIPAPQAVPGLSQVHMTHTRFRVGSPGAARAPRGTRFVYTLSAPARVTITILRQSAGRRKGHRCVKPRHGLKKPCTRLVRAGALTARSPAGQSAVAFSGRIRRKALRPGRYQARLVASNSAGRSKQRRLSFTVVKR